MRVRGVVPFTAVLLAVSAQSGAAQTTGRAAAADWTAWYGCWNAAETTDAASGIAPLVCVLPGDSPSAVRIATIENGEITEETVVRADGVARPIEDGGCTGSESAFFSNDGRRIFTRAELSCSGLGRVSTGVLAMVSETEWVDAQALTVNGQHAARTIRYRVADASDTPTWLVSELPQDRQLAQETARLDASMPLEIDAVVEASGHIASPAVEAMLAARQHGFGLDAAKLIALRDRGVPTSTIDVMVALSYPAKFAVAPRQDARDYGDLEAGRDNAAAAWVEDCYDPYRTSGRTSCYSSRYGNPYGYGAYNRNRYGYSPYGYDPYGWNYGSRPIVVIVRPDADEEPRGGSVVKGRGYTRTGTARGTANPRGAERTGSDPSPARATGSTTSSSSPPSSSTGGSSEPTRTAKPRGGGN
jgi:hypothetical protein